MSTTYYATFGGCELAFGITKEPKDPSSFVSFDWSSRGQLGISAQIGDNKIELGTVSREGNAVSFSAFNAAPNIRFKYRKVNVTRQVPVPLFPRTDFHIIQSGTEIRAVMIVEV